MGMLDTSDGRTSLELAAAAELVIPGTALRNLFALLRPNDLVFNYLVSGWLMGEPPTAFDVLAWNDDAAATPARFALDTTRIAVGQLGGPDPAAARPVVLGTPIDLSSIACDSFHIGGVHRPHHALADRLHHGPAALRHQRDDRRQVRPHPVVRQPGRQHAPRLLVRTAGSRRPRPVAGQRDHTARLVVAHTCTNSQAASTPKATGDKRLRAAGPREDPRDPGHASRLRNDQDDASGDVTGERVPAVLQLQPVSGGMRVRKGNAGELSPSWLSPLSGEAAIFVVDLRSTVDL